VVAIVVPRDPRDPPSLDALRSHAKEALPPHAAPKALELVDALPRAASGKTVRPRA